MQVEIFNDNKVEEADSRELSGNGDEDFVEQFYTEKGIAKLLLMQRCVCLAYRNTFVYSLFCCFSSKLFP
jgi:hypothetical protein